jgi:hypothetical protein
LAIETINEFCELISLKETKFDASQELPVCVSSNAKDRLKVVSAINAIMFRNFFTDEKISRLFNLRQMDLNVK